MQEYPTIVYKDGGNYHRNGGTYSFMAIADSKQLSSALADGWSLTLIEAINPQPKKKLSKRNGLD